MGQEQGKLRLTAIVQLEDDHYVALCPELDVVSQGDTREEATVNLKEACALFLEHACEEEIRSRLKASVHVTEFEAGSVFEGDLRQNSAVEDPKVPRGGTGTVSGEGAGGEA